MMPPPRRRTRSDAAKHSNAKGRELVRYAKAILESRGMKVEVAQNTIRWWLDPVTKERRPFSVHHDFFGCWDLLGVEPPEGRHFYQVTTRTNLAARRVKILAEGPWSHSDAILAYRGGRGRHFEVFWGPDFETTRDRWDLVPMPPTERRRRRTTSTGEGQMTRT